MRFRKLRKNDFRLSIFNFITSVTMADKTIQINSGGFWKQLSETGQKLNFNVSYKNKYKIYSRHTPGI